MTDYFTLYNLPVSFSPDQAVVKAKFYELSRQYHPDKYAQTGGTELTEALRMAAINNEAYKTLKNPDATMAYILKLNGLLEDEEKYALPPAFLMEMMDINEAISDYETNHDNSKDVMVSGAEPRPQDDDEMTGATNLLNEQLELWDDATRLLVQRFEKGENNKDLLLQIKDQYFRKKYLLRIKERIDRFAAR